VNGWYNHPFTIAWSGSDSTSGIATCSSLVYSGPDTGSAGPSGSCTDKAGNSSAPLAFPFKYDHTAPAVTPAADRGPDANGWYNHALTIAWGGSDPTSGIASCTAPVGYTGPDSGSASVSGSCSDKAGNSAGAAFLFKYDHTAPAVAAAAGRGPDVNGWYNNALTISWNGSDSSAGIASCTAPVGYSGPDSGSTSVSGSCTDKAGNSAGAVFPFKYDDTAPFVSGASPSRSPDQGGWYNHPLTIAWSGSDTTSGIASCTSLDYGGPDSASAGQSGSCSDKAGNGSAPVIFGFKYDGTGPAVTATADRGPDVNGWYNHPFTIAWSGSDATSGIASCSAPITYGGPDSSSAVPSGGCSDKAGNGAGAPFPFKYDNTAPEVTATAGRGPDANGWYNHPFTIAWSGSDATSGIASCTSLDYDGPEDARARVSGTCIDRAGNLGSALAFGFRYDGTPPKLWAVKLRPANRVVVLTWQASGADTVQITRSSGKQGSGRMLYAGKGGRFSDRNVENGTKYRYTLKAVDAAGNSVVRTVAGIPRPELFEPARGEHVNAQGSVLFAWLPDERATYFNLQLWLDGRIVAASWPTSPRFRLRSPWHFRGRLNRLEPGRYTWYVWPGLGKRKLGHYGRLIGKSTFVVGH